jgi:hypothetical protein
MDSIICKYLMNYNVCILIFFSMILKRYLLIHTTLDVKLMERFNAET